MNTPVVFADLHHQSLYASLQRLFEDRLGGTLLRPIGEDWFKEGYWLLAKPYNDAPETITQFLAIRDAKFDPYVYLNEIKKVKSEYYVIADSFKDQKAVTLEQFKALPIDIIVATYQPHYALYTKLRDMYHPKAKVICQQGNEWEIDYNVVKNLMASTLPYSVPRGVNAVFYHEEFDTNIYKYEPPKESSLIRSFVHTLSSQGMFSRDWQDFLQLERLLPQYKFESLGAGCRDGIVSGDILIAKRMGESAFGFHCKTGGDGNGFVIHQWAAMGKPLLYKSSQYKDRLASQLLENAVTGFDLDHYPLEEVASMITHLQPDQYGQMCNNMHQRFTDVVDFDGEEVKLKKFISNLV